MTFLIFIKNRQYQVEAKNFGEAVEMALSQSGEDYETNDKHYGIQAVGLTAWIYEVFKGSHELHKIE